MDAPSYSNPGEYSFESVADPSRGAWIQYTDECESHDFEFTMTASGIYNFRFYVMDKTSGVYYMRVSTNIQVSDRAYPSVGDIVNAAVKSAARRRMVRTMKRHCGCMTGCCSSLITIIP